MRSLFLISPDRLAGITTLPQENATWSADCIVLDISEASVDAVADHLGIVLGILRQWQPAAKRPKLYARLPAIEEPRAISVLGSVISTGVDGVVLPRALSGHDLTRLDARISVEEAVHGVMQGSIKIIAEAADTARSAMALSSFRGASHRLAGLIFSAERLAADMQGISPRTTDGNLRAPIAWARAQFLVAAASAGVAALFDNQTKSETRSAIAIYGEAYADGFDGAVTTEAEDIAAINAAMSGARS